MSTGKTGAGNGDNQKCGCKWKGCEGNPHETQVDYNEKDNGCVDRGSYVGSWPAPYCIQTSSYQNFGVKEGVCKGLSSTKYAPLGDYSSDVNLYRLEFHHVIPVEALATYDNLKTNLVLVGWNINDGISNGMCLPYFKHDQIWHALQPHRGSHPKDYQRDVEDSIAAIDEKCKEYCKLSETDQKKSQKTLMENIATLVDKIRNGILNWTIMVHLSDTLAKWTASALAVKSGSGYFLSRDDKSPCAPKFKPGPYGGREYLTSEKS